jgi:RNA polymerase sigma factor (sigma-70 family)
MNDAQLWQSFTEHHSEAAFRTLVERHLPLVFGTARRMTGENALAEDIAQTVFILLARKGNSLRPNTILSGWLYRTARFVTSRALTAEQRRRRREQEAVTMQSFSSPEPLDPELDDALARLGSVDRNAILLRYFEQQSLREVGLTLGLNEEAAKKRVARALEKLRRMLSRRGVEISAVALAAAMTTETAKAASVLPLAGKISAAGLAHGAAGVGVAASSPLLTNVLAALRWAKIQSAALALLALIAAIFVLPAVVRYWQRPAMLSATNTGSSDPAGEQEKKKPADGLAARLGNAVRTPRTLQVTVLDDKTGSPIPNATLSPYVNGVSVPEFQSPFHTGPDGVAKVPLPENVPGEERGDYCEFPVSAPGYATRVMRWASTTGMVLNSVSSEHTVRLSRGVTLSGVVVDDAGQPLSGMRIGALGFNLVGETTTMESDAQGHLIRTPAVHQEDYSSYEAPLETGHVVTDATGRFKLENFPDDVRPLEIDLLGPDGAMRKFQTPGGISIRAETLPKISLSDLKNGTALLVIPQGVTVNGVVVNNDGAPILGARVVEATEMGNLQILSQNETDAAGHFCLSNRPPHEVILGVSAEGSASVSAIVSIQPGMGPVRLQLPSAQPLRARVVSEDGFPLSSAKISTPDYFNQGQCLNWSDETDANGQFYWTGAPTNEVALAVYAPGYAPRLVRLRASADESEIIMRRGDNERIRITGHVTDADSGAPVDHFQMKVSHRTMVGDIPQGPTQNFDGSNGEINVELSRQDFPLGFATTWIMSVEADNYDAGLSRVFQLEEGDQQLDFKLSRGGTVEGVVHTPAGEPAAGAQLAFKEKGVGPVLSDGPGELSRQMATNASDANGCFKLKKPLLSEFLVILHKTGWAIIPITTGPQRTDVHLSSWAHIEGTVTSGGEIAANREIDLDDYSDFSDAMTILNHVMSDSEGHFLFDKVPAGTFKLSCRARESGRWDVSILQTTVSVAAGETTTVALGAGGRGVSAQLEAPPGFAAIDWSNALATLSSDVLVPPEPVRNDFVSLEAQEAALSRYHHDPAVVAALGRQRTFAGSVDSNGLVGFQQVPPGNYILEVKLFDPSTRPPPPNLNNDPAVVIAALRATVAVPEAPGTSENDAPVALGDFALSPP